MSKGFTELEHHTEDGAETYEATIKESKNEVKQVGIIGLLQKPDFIIPGAAHIDGSIEKNNYIVMTEQGDFFTYVFSGMNREPMYISTYEASWNRGEGRVRSIPGVYPMTGVAFIGVQTLVKTLGGTLPTISQWIDLCEWMVKTGAMSYEEVYEDSTRCGNYRNNPEGLEKLAKTGSNPNWMHNGIDNFTGNTSCWTIDIFSLDGVFHGGCFKNNGADYPASCRSDSYSRYYSASHIGFRVVLTKEHCEAMK